MNFEHVENIEYVEEDKKFEELPYTRKFDEAKTYSEVKKILQEEEFDLWRLPRLAELYALKKQNKSGFFKKRSYWAGNTPDELREFRIGFFGGAFWYYPSENSDPRYLVLIRKGTHIEGTEDEDIKEELKSVAL